MEYANCNDLRKCFARKDGRCTILTVPYAENRCPFAKSKQDDKLSYFAQKLRAEQQKTKAEEKISREDLKIVSDEIEALIVLHNATIQYSDCSDEQRRRLKKTVCALGKIQKILNKGAKKDEKNI